MPHGFDPLFGVSNVTMGVLYDSVKYVLLHYNGTQRLRKLGFPTFSSIQTTANLFRNTLLRLLLNPVPRLCNRIHKEQALLNARHLSCFQVRTGGALANVKENVSFLSASHYRDFVRLMHAYAVQNRLYDAGMNLFVSSDSDHAIRAIRNLTAGDVSFFSLSNIYRGHTAYSVWNRTTEAADVIFGSLLDLFLLKDCDMLIATCGSSYGSIAMVLREPNSFALPPLRQMKGCTVFPPKQKEDVHFFVRDRNRMRSC